MEALSRRRLHHRPVARALQQYYTPGAYAVRPDVGHRMDRHLYPRGGRTRISAPCASLPFSTSSVAPPTRTRHSTSSTCSARTTALRTASSRTGPRRSGGPTRSGTSTAGTDQLISGLIERLPAGTVNLGQKLVALKTGSSGGYVCTFESGATTHGRHRRPCRPGPAVHHTAVGRPLRRRRHHLTPAPAGHQRGAARKQLQVLRPVHVPGMERRPRHRQRLLRWASSKGHGTRPSTSPARPASSPRSPAAQVARLGHAVRPDQLLGPASAGDGEGLSRRVQRPVPRASRRPTTASRTTSGPPVTPTSWVHTRT